MTSGPPPSAAGPSHTRSDPSALPVTNQSSAPLQSPPASIPHPSLSTQPTVSGSDVPLGPYASQFQVQQPTSHSFYSTPSLPAHPVASQTTTTSYPPPTSYYSQQPPNTGTSQSPAGAYSYFRYPPNPWSNAWNSGVYQYPPASGYPYSYTAHAQPGALPAIATPQPAQSVSAPPPQQKEPTPSPSPPLPEYHKDWDAAVKSFLSAIGFSQALRGFEADMIMLNPEVERKNVQSALWNMVRGLTKLSEGQQEGNGSVINERPLEERKLDNLHLENGARPRSHTSITGDISRFLSRNRVRNDASNRNEFLLSLAEKRRRLNENGDGETSSSAPSCARTDAKTQNRDIQMKYDIAKNEDGPLRRTMQAASSQTAVTITTTETSHDYPTAERHPALDERLQNIEKHLSVRYVPSPPHSLLDRLKFLEDHIVHLEREYPPWAALHFNQPHRGWPPPPRATPLIVPSHLTSTSSSGVEPHTDTSQGLKPDVADGSKGKGRPRHTKSSLHRAVLEKLEVQKAIHDLAGTG